MRNIGQELNNRLRALDEERRVIERRLQTLTELEKALKLLIAEENIQLQGQQLPLRSVRSVNGKHSEELSPLGRFLVEIIADGAARPLKSIAELANNRGWDFQGKNPSRVLHFALIGLKRRGYAQSEPPSIWRLTSKALLTEQAVTSDLNSESGSSIDNE